MAPSAAQDERWMRLALDLAARGQGHVEPNPMVGCVIVRQGVPIGQGYHQRYGGPHAEREALASCGTTDLAGSTVYVTLEPCCHHGKTPPCSDALLTARPDRVVVAMEDPFPQVQGGGIEILRRAGIPVDVGICRQEAQHLNAPYLKRLGRQQPWIIAKWAMTLDGKLATATGSSKWISSSEARQEVHRLRGLVDAVMVGSQTARLDDPLLTARPPGPRTPVRIVVDSQATLSAQSRLVETAGEVPVIVAASSRARSERIEQLTHAGCEVVLCPGADHAERMASLLQILAQRELTNVLVEGGSQLLGLLLDMRQIDEVHAFIAPKLVGGRDAASPLAGLGMANMQDAFPLSRCTTAMYGDTIAIRGFTGFFQP